MPTSLLKFEDLPMRLTTFFAAHASLVRRRHRPDHRAIYCKIYRIHRSITSSCLCNTPGPGVWHVAITLTNPVGKNITEASSTLYHLFGGKQWRNAPFSSIFHSWMLHDRRVAHHFTYGISAHQLSISFCICFHASNEAVFASLGFLILILLRISQNGCSMIIWLVVDLPLWKMNEWKSVGIIRRNIRKNKKCSKPNQ